MSARVFLHPRCAVEGAAQDETMKTLAWHGYDVDRLRVFMRDELVRCISENDDGSITLERFDGHRFVHGMPQVAA